MSQGKLHTPEAKESAMFVPPAPSFDVAVNLRLVPKFSEKDPDIFFVFECLAEAEIGLMLNGLCYFSVCLPEAYCQRFRLARKEKQSYTEFARDLAVHFQRWCVSSQVKTFKDLQELILLEQFKNTLSDRGVTYLNEQKVTKVSEAAQLADEFVLTHKGFFGDNRGRGDSACRERSGGANSSNRL